MNKNTDQHAALAALPASFDPIANPPGWTRASDLDLYRRAPQPEGASPLPADATQAEAYKHAIRLCDSAHAELGFCLAARAAFDSNRPDPGHACSLAKIFRGALIAHFRAVDLSLACAADPDVSDYVNGQADEALFLEEAHERCLERHAAQPGSVSLMEFHALTTRMGGLATGLVEIYWWIERFETLYSAIEAATSPDRCRFLFTGATPQPPGPITPTTTAQSSPLSQ